MKIRASLAIIKNWKILLMHRFSMWKEYFILPWWWVEENEDIFDAAIREAREETNLYVEIEKELFNYTDDEYDSRAHHVFLVKNFSGRAKLWGPEAQRNSKNNKYILEWHTITKIWNLNFYPDYIKKNLSTIVNNIDPKE